MPNQPDESFDHAAPTAKTVAAGLSWVTAARVASMLITLVTTAILARLLTPADFGLIVIVTLVANLALCFVEGGIAMAVVQRATLTSAYVQMALILAGAVSALAIVLVATAIALGGSFIGDSRAHAVLLVSLIAFPFRGWNSVLTAVLQRQSRFGWSMAIAIASGIFGSALPAIAFATLGFGVWSLLAGFLTSALVEFAMLIWAVEIGKPRSPDWGLTRGMSRVFFAGGMMHLLSWAALSSPNIIVASSFGTAALGLFQRGGAIVNLLKDLLGQTLSRVLLPVFSSFQADPEKLKSAFEQSLAIGLPVFAAASVLLALHAELIVLILLGAGWTQTIPILQFLAIGLLPRIGYKITESLLVARGHFWPAALRLLFYFVLTAALCGLAPSLPLIALGVSVATFAYYGFSLWTAARLANAESAAIFASHVRALAFGAVVGGADFMTVHALDDAAPLLAHLGGAFCAGGAAAALFFVAPKWALGAHLVELRRLVRVALGRLAARLLRANAQL